MAATTRPAPVAPPGRRPVPWVELLRSGVGHGISAAAIGIVAVMALVVVGWTTADDPTSSAGGAARVAGAVWLAAHAADLSLGQPLSDGGTGLVPLTMAPLGITALVGALYVRSGQRLARLARSWGGSASALAGGVVAGSLVGGVVALVVASWAGGLSVSVDPAAAALQVASTGLIGASLGVLVHAWRRGFETLPGWLARPAHRWGTSATAAVVTWLTAGALVVAARLVIETATLVEEHGATAAGVAGGAFLLAGQVALLPNVAVWAAVAMSGTPVAVGGGSLTPAGSSVVEVPPLPVFAVLPDPGTFPVWAWAGVLGPVAAGAVAAWLTHRNPHVSRSSVLDRMLDALVVGAMTGAAAAALSWAGGGVLAGWGPVAADPLTVAAVTGAEVAAGALAAGLSLHLLSGRPIVVLPGARDRGAPRPGGQRVPSMRSRRS